ncbi:uncharacterized protein BHQ10_005159 [Talaromyces amestolkiae]|uniref:FAD/NAD(P)-binding domain-containing protein n=1 Tax=Talaromyces amestolkiae TaxID=1196081 RepID=A0A364L007_TALAM|nr:uncharacterized protein BHQ10_005159 [Talaromyces amestolkiae]RAO69147.1 hypothetical protein BHQ10_005159 [Talaromyces amestolkiae]
MTLPYIVVVGGSYVGLNAAQQLASSLSDKFHVILTEKRSHFNHLFAFPRFSVAQGVQTQKAFIPYVPGAFVNCPPNSGTVLQARVTTIDSNAVQLDREVPLDGIIATGTSLVAPSNMISIDKQAGVAYLQDHAQNVARSSKIIVIGGGAVGVQIATDIKELYPAKCAELGVEIKLGSRVKLPLDGFYPTDGSVFDVELEDESSLKADHAIICTGQTPQSDIIKSLSPECINQNGFIQTSTTLQISDARYPNIFAIGDVAETGAHKAAKPGSKQAALVVRNIQHIISNEPLEEYILSEPPGIHLTLGIEKSIAFGNPIPGSSEPFTKHRIDGKLDMNIDAVWIRKGGGPESSL